MSDALSAGPTFGRALGALSRVAGDRVMTHRVGVPAEDAAADLLGAVGLVWLALDEPASRDELTARLADADIEIADIDAELNRLLGAGLIVESVPDEAPRLSDSELVEVGLIAVFDTTVLVTSAEPLVDELRNGLANLAAGTDQGDTDRTAAPSHRLDVQLQGDTWTVQWDGIGRYQGPSIDLALYDSLIVLNHHASRRATELGCAVLHGGAVAIAGQVIAVVGHSGAGKSTLTTALTMRGHPYVADEVVAVSDDLTVAPFHRPIGLRPGGALRIGVNVPTGPYGSILPYHVPGALGGGESLGLVAVLRRTDEIDDARLVDLEAAEALFELSNQTLGSTDHERIVFRRLERLVRNVRVAVLHYRDVADAVAVLETFAAEPVDPRVD